MPKITVCIWLPGSGKTTYAKQKVESNPTKIVRVNKDDLRAMLVGRPDAYTPGLEKLVIEIRNTIITEAIMEGKDVIVDDTNLNPVHLEAIQNIAKSLEYKNVKVEIKDFRNINVEKCIERDAQRANPVWADVIRDMYNKYIKKADDVFPVIVQDESKEKVIIVDIDWTVARKSDRSPYDYSRVMEDTPYEDIIRILKQLAKEYRIVFVSWRSEECREQTEKWLCTNITFLFDWVFMRKEGDTRSDDIVKYEILKDKIVPRYYVEAVFDDRNRVVDMWRTAWIRCLQVQPWNF